MAHRNEPGQGLLRPRMEHDRQAQGPADVAAEERRRDEEKQQRGPQPALHAGLPQDVDGSVDGDDHRQENRDTLNHDQVSRPVCFPSTFIWRGHRDGFGIYYFLLRSATKHLFINLAVTYTSPRCSENKHSRKAPFVSTANRIAIMPEHA